jgi:pimeloyl-ACP methyl ester carboxylesterase
MSETLMMIHGMYCCGWHWRNYEAFFNTRGYRCLSPTLRYHDMGERNFPHPELGATSLLDYAQDMENQISKLPRKPIIMGHSMGGLIAQILGSRGRAKALVLLAPASPRGINPIRWTVIRSFWTYLGVNGFWKKPLHLSFETAMYAAFNLLPVEDRKANYERCVYESGRAAAEMGFWMFDPKGASKVDASAVTCPVLVVSGTKDRMTPPSVVRKVAKKYQGSTYKEFQNHAHWMIGEPGWEKIAGFIDDWLSSNIE